RLDLRVGNAASAGVGTFTSLTSFDGWAIYGITPKREVARLTPSGPWTLPANFTPTALLPQPDGSLVMVDDVGNRSMIRRLHPPEPRVTDTASVPRARVIVQTTIGDRIYFAGDSGLAGVRVRDLARTKTIPLPATALDAVPTPSGDRIFVALAGRSSIA